MNGLMFLKALKLAKELEPEYDWDLFKEDNLKTVVQNVINRRLQNTNTSLAQLLKGVKIKLTRSLSEDFAVSMDE